MPRTTSIVPAQATEIPSLKNGNDKAVAEKLRLLIRDAEDGLMRIARLGAFIDHIRDNLPHGHFQRWLAAHCDDVNKTTVFRWRKICAGLLNDAGITGQKLRALERPLYEVLELPLESLSEKEAEIVESIRDAAQHTGYKKLENRPKKEIKALSPVESVNARNLASYKHWSLMIGELDLALGNDSLNQAIHHDPAFATRIETVRLRLGDLLKEVVRAHKRESSVR